jgi:hypothetical protein
MSPSRVLTQIFIKLPYGGPGGIRTPVQNTFLSASYSNNFYLIKCGHSSLFSFNGSGLNRKLAATLN